jgi:site-specific recombinase XerD
MVIMALERVVNRHGMLSRRLRRSRLWITLDGFGQWLFDHGRLRESVRIHLWRVRCLTAYLERRGVAEPSALAWEHIEGFLSRHLAKQHRQQGGMVRHRGMRCAVRRFAEYLVSVGILPPPPASPPPAYHALLEEHLAWLKNDCGRSALTVAARRRYLPAFLEWLGLDRLSELSPRTVQEFFVEYARGCSGCQPVSVATALRVFFRFGFQRGYIRRDLSSAIPSFVRRLLSGIPRGISEENAQRLLHSIERRNPLGRRDYAIVQLLYTYGVRAGQVSRLRLADIQWSAGQIRFPALKGGKTVIDPLTDEVGDSLLEYLQRGRAPSSCPEVFLTARYGAHPISSTLISTMVGRRLQSAGIRMSPRGAHVFRHGFASRLLAAGQSLKTIADWLGHRDIQTTAIYAKVDFRMLTSVALEWPEDQP